MTNCVLCNINNTFYGIQHSNGNAICMVCVLEIKDAHIKVREFPYEDEKVGINPFTGETVINGGINPFTGEKVGA